MNVNVYILERGHSGVKAHILVFITEELMHMLLKQISYTADSSMRRSLLNDGGLRGRGLTLLLWYLTTER